MHEFAHIFPHHYDYLKDEYSLLSGYNKRKVHMIPTEMKYPFNTIPSFSIR